MRAPYLKATTATSGRPRSSSRSASASARRRAGHRGDLLEHELRRARAAGREGDRQLARGGARVAPDRAARARADDVRDRRGDAGPYARGYLAGERAAPRRHRGQPDALLGDGQPRLDRVRRRGVLPGAARRRGRLRRVARGDEGVRRGEPGSAAVSGSPIRGVVQRLVRPRRWRARATTAPSATSTAVARSCC